MSKAVSALAGAEYQGFAHVADTGLRGMITLRGDLGSPALTAVVQQITDCPVPGQGEIRSKRSRSVAWMSPDELMLFGPYGSVHKDMATLADALKGQHHLLANVSDARAVFRVTGENAADVIAKISPADLRGFAPGTMRRTRLAQVPAAFHMPKPGIYEVICFRSMATYMFDLLANAAQSGTEI